ncbi:cellulose binding domain-containing protein [Mastigocoleus testarum]|uniref:cellulose binding domain-containing protein n=1 Tax=Mastigocoleus testarum TaxID=996925 RepID=UPI0022864BA4|nr:cellulose binding domain-containing protein [Mastigocoleus testarum]
MGDVDFSVRSEWNTGFTGNVGITNTGGKAINGWKLEFTAPFEVNNIWGGKILSHEGNQYTIESAEWDGFIAPGASIELGFNGTNSDNMQLTLNNVELNDVPIGTVDQTAASSGIV